MIDLNELKEHCKEEMFIYTGTCLELIEMIERKQNEINHLHSQILELKGDITVLNSVKREGN